MSFDLFDRKQIKHKREITGAKEAERINIEEDKGELRPEVERGGIKLKCPTFANDF
jgi:hypothetical protein